MQGTFSICAPRPGNGLLASPVGELSSVELSLSRTSSARWGLGKRA